MYDKDGIFFPDDEEGLWTNGFILLKKFTLHFKVLINY